MVSFALFIADNGGTSPTLPFYFVYDFVEFLQDSFVILADGKIHQKNRQAICCEAGDDFDRRESFVLRLIALVNELMTFAARLAPNNTFMRGDQRHGKNHFGGWEGGIRGGDVWVGNEMGALTILGSPV